MVPENNITSANTNFDHWHHYKCNGNARISQIERKKLHLLQIGLLNGQNYHIQTSPW